MITTGAWTREELAWCAAIVEGEGSILSVRRNHGTLRHLCVRVAMTDLDVLQELQRVLGGNLRGPYARRGHKPIWNWDITQNAHAYAVLVALYPWLRARRREQVRVAVMAWLTTNRDRRAALARCDACDGPRHRRYTGDGRPNGWRCLPCDAADQRARKAAA